MTSTPRHASNNLLQPVEIKKLMVWFITTTYFLHIFKKLNFILLVTCQWITSKKYWQLWWVNTWACNTVRWYWSPDTLFWQLSIYHNMNVQYQAVPAWAPKLVRKCEMPRGPTHICDPPQDFNAKGESTRTTRFHFKTKEFILTRFSTLAILPH